jgi:hypothetical protein
MGWRRKHLRNIFARLHTQPGNDSSTISGVDEVDDEFPRCCIRAGDFVAFAYNSDPGTTLADD